MIPINPCGFAVDWGRRPYTTLARLSDDPDAPLVRLVWFVTNKPFQDFPSVINSLDWDEEPWRARTVGEVFQAPRTYNGRWAIGGLNTNHQCGIPEDFLQGSPWPYTGPPVEYDAENIPLCCGRTVPAAVVSGAQVGAIAGFHRFFVLGPTSGAGVGAIVRQTHRIIGARGAVISGAQVGAIARRVVQIQTGPTSGAQIHALIIQAHEVTTGPTSGAQVGAIVAATPVPGHTCAAAGEFPDGQEYNGAMSAPMAQDWFFVNLISGQDYEVVVSDGTGAPFNGSWNVYDGTCSALSSLIGGFQFTTGSQTFTAPATETGYIQITAFGAMSYHIEFHSV